MCQALFTAENVGCKKVPGSAGQCPQTEPRAAEVRAASQNQYCTKLASCLGKQHSIKHEFLNKDKGFIKQGNNKISVADLVKLLLRDPGNCCALQGMMEQQINYNCLDFHQSVPYPALSSV